MLTQYKLDLVLSPGLQAYLKRLEEFVWFDGFRTGAITMTIVFLVLLVVLAWFRKP